jgi:hydrogenase/urease accessory protein HupE
MAMKAAVRESESGTAVVSATEMGVSATEMPSPEMTAAEMMATTVTSTVATTVTPTVSAAVAVASTFAECHARQHGREHDDRNSNAWSRHSTLTAPAARH